MLRLLNRVLLDDVAQARVRRLRLPDAGHGYDELGLSRDGVAFVCGLFGLLHRYYFRVRTYGIEHVPAQGGALLVSNHGGLLPFDAVMIGVDVFARSHPVRSVRVVADHFVQGLPAFGGWLARAGMTNGAPSDVRLLLERGELVLIFPEGMHAIGKSPEQRYQLSEWRIGHAELALRCGVPIVPVAVIGAADQWTELLRIEKLRPFGIPYLPIPRTPLPLPVRYHIHYGAPIQVGAAVACPTPTQVEELAATSQRAVASLLEYGLRMRKGLFR
jgi:1-acyl-sn-glycerol-3-phosphate acyltransferase